MGTLHLVRHGQASFGAADYDQLSDLGRRQCQRLGAHFRARGMHFDAVLRGSLRRHEQSLQGIVEGYGELPAAQVFASLDEYDSQAVLRTVHDGPLHPPRSKEEYRDHFRLLRDGLARWMNGEITPAAMPSFADFRAGVLQVLDHVRSHHRGDVLLVSSGGPISTAVAAVLAAPAQATIELNLRIRNSAITEFAFTPKRHMLHTFNQLPHLDDPTFAEWVTYT